MAANRQGRVAWDRLVARYGRPTCPICGDAEQRWEIYETIDAPIAGAATPRRQWFGLRRSRWSMRYVPAVCQTCGHTLLFDAGVFLSPRG